MGACRYISTMGSQRWLAGWELARGKPSSVVLLGAHFRPAVSSGSMVAFRRWKQCQSDDVEEPVFDGVARLVRSRSRTLPSTTLPGGCAQKRRPDY